MLAQLHSPPLPPPLPFSTFSYQYSIFNIQFQITKSPSTHPPTPYSTSPNNSLRMHENTLHSVWCMAFSTRSCSRPCPQQSLLMLFRSLQGLYYCYYHCYSCPFYFHSSYYYRCYYCYYATSITTACCAAAAAAAAAAATTIAATTVLEEDVCLSWGSSEGEGRSLALLIFIARVKQIKHGNSSLLHASSLDYRLFF